MKAQKKKEVLKVLKANGWQLIRTNGGHDWWAGPDGQGEAIPRHNEISAGVIRKLAKKLAEVPQNWK
ncbi:type II toxin-antitoxin system HicA family toxin [Pseudarthrobacter sp. J47]|uniref:type II toxin-antitoxin system HicA family toxin n=1 Tax=Pseudarthrobacter sp. J47 TaxID=3116482 RepID=UPI002E804E38|nr:type II toxin-antitoxin system HicA family toxin [Pseudarthrobacter sp. J47]MEE2524528.1 type II toxin-antitoxin system HicA family toxin [Pseudarthrobacter sp. J47]